jgi:ABC-type multidrug transport system ATPase subunit
VIEVDQVVKTLGERTVLDHVSFVAPAGTITGLLGPNGAGKTTTMRLVATLLRPDAGSIRLAGVDVATDPIEARRRIGLVTEEPGLLDRLTVREQLSFNAQAYGLSTDTARRRIDELADLLGFAASLDQRAGTLSKGNRQKVSLCRALVHDPPILLLDEPTSGLDVVAAAGLEDLLRRPALTGDRTVLLSTHRLDEVERLAFKVVGIADGRVVVDATPEQLVHDSGSDSFRDAFVRRLGAAALGGGG